MAKNDSKKTKEDQDFVETDIVETAEPDSSIEPSTQGLVKMHKGGQHIHAHPSTVKHHEGKGWKLL